MKIAIKILTIVLLCAVGLFLLVVLFANTNLIYVYALNSAVAHNYNDIEQGGDGFSYLIRERNRKAGVCRCTVDPELGDCVIDIPES